MRRTVLILILIAATGVFATTFARAVLYAPTDAADAVPPEASAYASASTTPEQVPVRVRIPAIGVDAPVGEVGINAKGEMAVPASYQEIGWYRYGPVPGHRGSAALAGHVDNGLSLPGVFKRLGEVQPGAEVIVETTEGRALRFVVERVERYGYRDVPMADLVSADGPARIALITCAGAWVRGERTYDERLVAYARLAPQTIGEGG